MLRENSVAVLLQEAKRIAKSMGLQKLPLPLANTVAFLSRHFLCDEHIVGGGDKMQSWNWPVLTSGVIFQPIWGRKL